MRGYWMVPCLIAIAATLITLWESIGDLRAIIRRHRDGMLRSAASHGIKVEIMRVVKVTLLTLGVYIGAIFGDRVWAIPARSAIMTAVALLMGITSAWELWFRGQMGIRLRAEHGKKKT